MFDQPTLEDLGTPLHQLTFVVVDLETTGGSPADAAITEIGAVKVRGGEVLGEFQTLVNPGVPIPPFIAVLTGISDALVAAAPSLAQVLPAFLEFCGLSQRSARGGPGTSRSPHPVGAGTCSDTVLVAHNAPFDMGFLKAACAATERPWPAPRVVDTARLARQVLTSDDAANCKLATLARVFHSATTPNHRALTDAQATVDVLHGLLERLAGHGVQTLEELESFSSRVSPQQRGKRHLAEGLPSGPGVYVFRDGQGRPLYVGTSKDIRSRVRTYFTASELRSRMVEMVGLAESVTAVPCPTVLEAQVRELRLIAAHKPRYNRRSRHPERAVWLKLTVEAFPRLSLVRRVSGDGATYLGPFGSRRLAEQAMAAVHDAVPLRQCTERLSPRRLRSACVLAGIGRCGAPCEGRESAADYAAHVAATRAAFTADARSVVDRLLARVRRLAEAQRYEDAAAARDRLSALVRAAARMQRLASLTACPLLVAAQPTPERGWEVAAVRHGRLVGTTVVPRSAPVRPAVAALLATAEPAPGGPGPTPAASAEETECVLRWLEQPGTRLVDLAGEWASPRHGAAGHQLALGLRQRDARDPSRADPHADRRRLRPVSRPPALVRGRGAGAPPGA